MKGRNVDIDRLVDDEASVDDGREGFAGGSRRRIPGARAFVAIMCLIGIALIGLMIWRALHPPKPSDDSSGKPQAMTNALPKYEFNASPLGTVANSPASATTAASASADSNQPEARTAAHQNHVPTPEELAAARRLGQGGGSAASGHGGEGPASAHALSRVAARAEPNQ